ARAGDGAFGVIDVFDFVGPEVLDAALRGLARVDVVEHHTLAEQASEGLVEFQQAQVAHDARPETRIQQVQHGVFDAPDVLVHGHPVVVAGIYHGLVVVGRGIAHEVPRRIDEGVHGVGLAARGLAATGARARQEGFVLGERVAGAVGEEVVGQHDGQVWLGHRHGAAVGAVDDGDGGAPVPLARDAPVAQAPGGLLFAQALRGEIRGDGVDRLAVRQAVIFARVDRAANLLVGIPVLPGVGGVRLSFDADDLPDGQLVLAGKGEIAFVVRRHTHD